MIMHTLSLSKQTKQKQKTMESIDAKQIGSTEITTIYTYK